MFNSRSQPTPQRQHRTMVLALVAVAAALWLAWRGVARAPAALADRLGAAVTIFFGIFLEALPFLLLGVLVSSAIHLWVSPERVQRLIPRSLVLASLTGVLLGLTVLPVCECGTVPATRRLLAKGAPLSFGITYLLSAPIINPVVIASTWIAFGGNPRLVIGRVVIALIVAVVVGLLIGADDPQRVLLPDSLAAAHDHHHGDSPGQQFVAWLGHSADEFCEMGRYLIVGAAVAALVQTMLPRDLLLALGQGPFWSIIVLMVLAAILSICSTVDAFVALGLIFAFSPGAVLAFLVFGPMIDIKSVLLYGTVFRRRTVVALVALTAIWTVAAALVVNLLTLG